MVSITSIIEVQLYEIPTIESLMSMNYFLSTFIRSAEPADMM